MSAVAARTLTCGYCAQPFTEDRGQPACRGCPLADGCRTIRCPHCGYENPLEPAWLGRLARWLGRDEPGRLAS